MAGGVYLDSPARAPDVSSFTPIPFPRSDGDSSKRPPNVDPTPDAQGSVNYYRLVPSDEVASVNWRKKIGEEVAKALGYPNASKHILEAWPENYAFYDHNKGPQSGPRHDLYLFGKNCHVGAPITAKFRSTNEFIPHAIWLLTDETLTPTNCKCKYCTKSKSQKQISESHGLSTSKAPQSVPTGVRRVPPAVKSKAVPSQVASKERSSDLRSKRWFREGELVWCALRSELRPSTPEHPLVALKFWPTIIQECRLKVDSSRRQSNGPPEESYDIDQTYSYRVKLLALMQASVVQESSILPYQAYQPPRELLDYLSGLPKPSLSTEQDMEKLSSVTIGLRGVDTFVPRALEPNGVTRETTLQDAGPALILAIEIAAQMSRMWSPTDDWQWEGRIPDAEGTMQLVKHLKFQGLWWGIERIWQEDMIRLQMARTTLHPSDHNLFLEPSPSAQTRGIFMRIASIFLDGEGELRKCKVAGMIYELADADWETKPKISVAEPAPFAAVDPSQLSVSQTPAVTPGPSQPLMQPPPFLPAPEIRQSVVDFVNLTTTPPSTPPPSSPARNGSASRSQKQPLTPLTPLPPSPSVAHDRNARKNLKRKRSNSPAIDFNVETGLSGPGFVSADGPKKPYFIYPLPAAPTGYVFRPILPPSYEAVYDISHISGRYYPGLLDSPLLKESLDASSSIPLPDLLDDAHGANDLTYEARTLVLLKSLVGFYPGYFNSMNAFTWRSNRYEMARDADYNARLFCHQRWHGHDAGLIDNDLPSSSPPLSQPHTTMTSHLSTGI
ncbi:hypothetical protein SISSUDRAFT_1124970 [Sistotremastrum suecicum HHB10207 ss-3]|uniref:Cryptic loci regulator 2 N-terminal domain-containing protein n=1 Tax=Sistotremastrum suecicum HHB10207 ss-3 TaxID=1314776 RepID=A0A166HTV7_9AGAM|nr:hypothetical protein SISSUDRAFT_1124970 [Sistotremastrum suecicum HHB10207 ss-3]